MKTYLLMLLLLTIHTQLTHAMDAPLLAHDKYTQTNQKNTTPEDILNTIDALINEEHNLKNSFFNSVTLAFGIPLTTERMNDICAIVEKKHPEHLTDSFITSLYEKNKLFAQIIDFFTLQATKNLALITTDNIKIIENSTKQQPTRILNKLPLALKTYVMNRALEQTQHSYEIILSGYHKERIITFDICELTDQAVTSSFNPDATIPAHKPNNLLLLWDLKTGNPTHVFDEPTPISLLAFNPNGSCIAGSLFYTNAIKVWCAKTGQPLHYFPSTYGIYSLAYSEPTGTILTAVCPHIDPEQARISQWMIATPTESDTRECINCSFIFDGRGARSSFDSNKYQASHPITYLTVPRNKLYITKKNCNSLYLCQQAIKNTPHLKPGQIEKSASYHQLTSLEMTAINTKINNALQINNNQQKHNNIQSFPDK